jgi:DNA-directed RNA polymerase sigma subunit (sigma70/sigma32)
MPYFPAFQSDSIEESLLHTLNALCGGAKVTATQAEMSLRLEQINSLLKTLVFMDHRLQRAIIKRLGLFGESESTWDEIRSDLKVSREQARQIFHRALRILRKKTSQTDHVRSSDYKLNRRISGSGTNRIRII